jgi:hypothetical protein
MMYLSPSPSIPGHWRLGELELTQDNVIEVLLLDKWYRGHVQYNWDPQECQLLIAGHPYGMSLIEGRSGRWPETDSKAEGEGVEKPET